MATDSTERRVQVGSESVRFTVCRGDRKRARIVVRPTGLVEARVPFDMSTDRVDDLVRGKARWIFRQLDYFDQFTPRDPERQYVNGETIRYLGRQYRLKVVVGDWGEAKLRGRHLVVTTGAGEHGEVVREQVEAWYRHQATKVFERRVSTCLDIARPHGVERPAVQVRKMKRRWGSCTPLGRVLLNPLLVIAPTDCIDYVILHELCHLKHGHHNRAFYRLLSTWVPDWQARRRRLALFARHLVD